MSPRAKGRRAKTDRNCIARIDLHVHTGRYSQCAEMLDPYLIEDFALRSGVSGVVLTEHDMQWQDEEIELLRASLPRIAIFRGIEVSADGCHLLVIGMDDTGGLMRGANLKEIVRQTAVDEAAVILAHPFRDADPGALPLHLVDAVEIASTSFTQNESKRARQLAMELRKPAVAASDAHALTRVGWAWTEFPRMPADEAELARLIRDGAGRPIVLRPFPA